MKSWRLIATALLSLAIGGRACAELVVLVPMTAGNQPVMRADPKGISQAPILKRAESDAISKGVALEATRGAVKFMLAMDEQAQRIAGTATPAPTYLLRSQEEGGFARRGFWLAESGNKVTWHSDPYVDLAVDKQSIDDGAFEEIFAHEMGHLLLRRLMPRLPNGLSRTPHSSLAITDYPTAFDEGFAIHFQGLARHLSANAQLKATDEGLTFKPFLPYWQSNVDRTLRIRGVRDNLFVHQQLAVALDLGDATSLFDVTHFKNGQQMLSSEGVVATLFYHLLLQPGDNTAQLAERYKSLLGSLHALNIQKLASSTPFMLSLVQTHIERVPAEREQWIGTVLNLTYGATASTSLLRDMTKLSALGQEGRTQEFQVALKQARAALASLTSQIVRNPQRLAAALGPEVWLAFKQKDGEVTVNLNTAEKTTLLNAVGLASLDADLLLADRAARGPFVSVDDFVARRKVPPLWRKRLLEAHELATRLGGFERP
jgi:DNA uptake protein ComE-like DNA-binding protein